MCNRTEFIGGLKELCGHGGSESLTDRKAID